MALSWLRENGWRIALMSAVNLIRLKPFTRDGNGIGRRSRARLGARLITLLHRSFRVARKPQTPAVQLISDSRQKPLYRPADNLFVAVPHLYLGSLTDEFTELVSIH